MLYVVFTLVFFQLLFGIHGATLLIVKFLSIKMSVFLTMLAFLMLSAFQTYYKTNFSLELNLGLSLSTIFSERLSTICFGSWQALTVVHQHDIDWLFFQYCTVKYHKNLEEGSNVCCVYYCYCKVAILCRFIFLNSMC